MKILWLDINSSYSHSSVALPAIHAQVCDRTEWEWSVVRATINDNPGVIAAAVAEQKPDIIAATFWLFTHNMQIEVLARVKQLLENVDIICGGPEFLGNNEEFLKKNNFILAVFRGEGEIAVPMFLDCIHDKSSWNSIDGLCWISPEDGLYHDNGTARVKEFATLKYPEESSFFCWDKPFVQLETTRGCFNTCAFCVSGGEKPVRYQSIGQVKARLENICSHGIKDIRVLDRTFNYDIVRARELLDIFAQYNGRLRFHLEIHPSLLTDTLKQKLASLPKGLLHLEAGIQSLDENVLKESGRKGSLKTSLDGLKYLCNLNNLQTHADLIVGLPSYSLNMLIEDVHTLIEIGADELQVESLKILPGTQMRESAKKNGLKYSPLPPYEILETPAMSPREIRKAMQISRTLDLYYNCPTWQNAFKTLASGKEEFIISFTDYLAEKMVLESPVSLERRGIILYEYCQKNHPEMIDSISLAWIRGGFSLKKMPAGNTHRVKNIDSFFEDHNNKLRIEYGIASPTHRYYIFSSEKLRVLFGYDAMNHHSEPVFWGLLQQSEA